MDKFQKIENYYLGVILAHPTYYRKDRPPRYLDGINFDPFENFFPIEALTYGATTLLYKKGDTFYDEYNSIFKYELAYQLGKVNKERIVLAYYRNVTDYYDEEAPVFIKEEIENNSALMERVFNEYPCYISHSKIDKTDALIIQDGFGHYQIHEDYRNSLFGKKVYQKNRG